MDIKFWILIGAFYLIRAFLSNKKKNEKKANQTGTPVPKKTQSKGLDDIFGDFMKEINKGQEPKKVAQPVLNKDDYHKAEADTHKKLDWQKVSKSKFQEKEQLIKHSDYKNVSHSDIPDEPIVATKVENDVEIEALGKINLRKAILYKEILDRKYFSI